MREQRDEKVPDWRPRPESRNASSGARWFSWGRLIIVLEAVLAIFWLQPLVFHSIAVDEFPVDGWHNSLAAILATLCAAVSVVFTYLIVESLSARFFAGARKPLPISDVNALRELLTRVANQVSLLVLGSRKDRDLGDLFREMEASSERACSLAESLESSAPLEEGLNASNLIVVFERDPEFRRRCRSELGHRGYRVVAYASVELALEVLDLQKDEVLLALISWDGKSFEAPEVAAGMRRRRADLPILILCENDIAPEEAIGLLRGPGRVLPRQEMIGSESMSGLVKEIRHWHPGKAPNV